MQVQRLVLGALETNCFVVGDDAGGPLVVIDPAGEPDAIIEAIAGRPVAHIVLTHGHFDHLGAATVVAAATGAPLSMHELDADCVDDPEANGGAAFGFFFTAPSPARRLLDGDRVTAGALSLEVIHTPGHTPGSMCLLGSDELGPQLFSGDTLFAGSVGRTDFPGGDARALKASIGRLATLDPATLVHPGHGPDTTIERESRVNFYWPRT